MTRTAVEIDGVAKTFRIATEPAHSVKERLVRLVTRGRGGFEEFNALGGIDASIASGETVGIVGHNGSGKSTLLKCIAGIITPSTGTVRVRGRLTSLLELGAGFHPDLTGRDNVYINAAFYGMGRREIDRIFDAIVDFAELERFIDEPVKHYSSGMYVRLGFAVAVNLDPDVLLVDEVLAVGDEVFQAKCISRIKQFQSEGRTIVFVTHDAETVRRVCDRALVLDHGRLVLDGEPGDAIRVFRDHLHGRAEATTDGDPAEAPAWGGPIAGVRTFHDHEAERRHLEPGEALTIDVSVRPVRPIAEPVLSIEVGDRLGRPIYHVDSDALGRPLAPIAGEHIARITLGNLWLLDGDYRISLKLTDRATGEVLDWRDRATTFTVSGSTRADGIVALDVRFD
ncbi:MAG: ABC transporter ATP-binding protein [Desertimonas sp.]